MGFPNELTLKTARISSKQSGTGGIKNGTVPKRSQPMMAETERDVVHCPPFGNKQWMFDPRLADVYNQSHIFSFGGTGDSILTNIGGMCWYRGFYPDEHRWYVLVQGILS